MSTTKRIIDALSVDDLVSIATSSKEEIVMDKLTPVAKFIYELGIKHGNTKVPAYMIYYAYREWNGWDKPRQSKPEFFKDFRKYFEAKRTNDGIVYLLNPKPFDLSETNFWKVRAAMRHEKSRQNKKNKTK